MIPDPLAPANAAADATVAALQRAPAAPRPDVGQSPPPAPAPSAPVAAPAPAPGATPAPPGQAAPPAALARVPGLLEQIDAGAAKAAEQAGKLVAAPPADPGMLETRSQTQLAATPEQAQAGAAKLGEAQGAGANAAQKTMQQAAAVDVNEYWQKRAAQQLAEQRYLAEKQATDAIQERVMQDYQQTSEGELDPDRVFSGAPGSGWGLISTILGMIVGGAAAGPVGAIMMAVKGIDKAVRSDLDRQKEVKNSRLKQYEEILGDQQLAYSRLYSQQLNLAAMQAETIAAESKARGTMGNIHALPDILKAQKAREEERFIKEHQTKRSLEYTNKLLLEKKGPAQALDPGSAQVHELFRRHGVNPESATYRAYNDNRVKVAPYMGAVKTAGRTLEEVMAREGGQDVPGLGRFDEKMPIESMSDGGRAVVQTFTEAMTSFANSKTGAAISKEEERLFKLITSGKGSLADARRGLEIMRRRGQSSLDEFDDNYPMFRNLRRDLDALERGQNPTPYNESDLSLKAPPMAGPSPGVIMMGDDEAKKEAEARAKRKTAGGKAVEGALFGGDAVDEMLTK